VLARPLDPARELEAAARLLAERWTLALPTAIGSALSAAIIFFTIGAVVLSAIAAIIISGPPAALGVLTAGALTVGLAICGIIVISTLSHAVVVTAAHEAWAGREPDFGTAFRLVLARLPSLLAAAVAVGVLALVPLVLCLVLIGVPLLMVLGFFLMYVTPAIVVGGEGGLAAIRSSFRLTARYPGPSTIGFVGILAAFLIGRVADTMFVHIPLIGVASAFVIGGVTAAYGSLVAVRFYDLLRPLSTPGPLQLTAAREEPLRPEARS
jgi:hypothetical protein